MDSGTSFNYKLLTPAQILIAGPSQSGKSTLAREIVLGRDKIFDTKFDSVYWCYNELESQLIEISQLDSKVLLHKGPLWDINEGLANPPPVLVVFDDFNALLGDKNFEDLFVWKCSRRNLTCIVMCHNIFQKKSRTMSINVKYFFLLKNCRDNNQLRNLAGQMYPKQSGYFMKAYQDATYGKPFGYLFVSCDPRGDPNFKLRSSIWPEKAVIYQEP